MNGLNMKGEALTDFHLFETARITTSSMYHKYEGVGDCLGIGAGHTAVIRITI